MKAKSERESKKKAAYATVEKFSKVLDKIRNLQYSQVGKKELANIGLSASGVSSVMSALKFLGLINEDCTVTDKYKSLRLDSSYRKVMDEIVRQAYNDVFKVLGDDLSNKSKGDIQEAIFLAYPEMAKGSTPKATHLFTWLCSEAGIDLPIVKEARTTQVKGKKGVRTPTVKKKLEEVSLGSQRDKRDEILGIPVNFSIPITKDTTEEEIFNILKKIQNAIDKLNEE